VRGLGDWPQAALQARLPLQRSEDSFQDAVEVAIDLVVVESSDPIALIPQKRFALRVATALVVGGVSRAIDLDDKFLLAADEVTEIGTDRLLPNEFESAENTASKSPPEQTFSLGLVLAQVSRTARFL
jgi:hypothetical protein